MLKSLLRPLKYLLKFVWGIYQLMLGMVLISLLFGIYWLVDYTEIFPIKKLERENPGVTAFMQLEESRIAADSLLREKIIKDRKARSLEEILWREWLPWDSIPRQLIEMAIIAEDGKFYSHQGFDLEELQYALVSNQQKGRAFRGASTISQQVVKNIFLSGEKSYERKLKEALLTVLLEQFVSKNRILEIYLNIAQFAPGVFGIEAGARHHFGKPAALLDLNQSIELVALLPSPNKWHPLSTSRAYRRHKMRLIKNLSLYRRYKNKLPDNVMERYFQYAEQERQERWNQLHDGQKEAFLDSLPGTGKEEGAGTSN